MRSRIRTVGIALKLTLARCTSPAKLSPKCQVYVLRSQRHGQFYVGFTGDLKRRFKEHNDGRVDSTRSRAPLDLI